MSYRGAFLYHRAATMSELLNALRHPGTTGIWVTKSVVANWGAVQRGLENLNGRSWEPWT